MTRGTSYLAIGAALVAVSTAAIAATFGMIRLATVKTTREVLNFYASDKPVGGENAVPTIHVVSLDKVSYDHVATGLKSTANLEFRQVCAGGGWKQYRIPHVYVGDQQWPGTGDGKPVLQPDTALYKATLKVSGSALELNPGLDAVKRCNAVINAHTFNGKLPADLLKNGFWIRHEDGIRAKISPGCVKPTNCVGFCEDQYAGQESHWLPVWINCLPTGYVETHRLPPEPHRTKPEPQRLPGVFRSILLEAVNSPLNHICPAVVVFRGKLQSNAAVAGSYRLVGSGGYASPSYPFSLGVNGEKSISWPSAGSRSLRRQAASPIQVAAAGRRSSTDGSSWRLRRTRLELKSGDRRARTIG